MRRLWGVLVVLLMVAGCSAETVDGAPDRTQAPTGPTDLASPIELARVAPTATAATTQRTDQDGATLNVEQPFLTITRLDRAAVEFQQSTWVLAITLTEEDRTVFADWTAEHTGEQAAMIVDDEVVFAPTIQEPIASEVVIISAQYTQDEATALLHKITGR